MKLSLAVAALLGLVSGQQAGKQKQNFHPPMSIKTCHTQGGCTEAEKFVTLDANWRWIHNVGGYQNCYQGASWDKRFCPNNDECAKNCAIDGVQKQDWMGIYGVDMSGKDSMKLKLKQGGNVGSRSYMLNKPNEYEMFQLLNQEFTFTVDVSKLPCGTNGALYFVAMDKTGDMGGLNNAGAAFGTGYCDAQCPHDIKFIKGTANSEGWNPTGGSVGSGKFGSCCPEMDIWEANSISSAYTAHPCTQTSLTKCEGLQCGDGDKRYQGICDKDGCDLNPFRVEVEDFYGPGKTIDTTKPVTVVTQFHTNTAGDLIEIRRKFIQNGKVFEHPKSKLDKLHDQQVDSISDNMCGEVKTIFGDPNDYQKKGGLKQMGAAMKNGMVLVMSLWDDAAAHMLWLDSTYPTNRTQKGSGGPRGTCPTTSGDPGKVEHDHPNAGVTYSDIRVGDIDSTYHDLVHADEEVVFLQ